MTEKRLRVAIAGSGGLIGTALSELLRSSGSLVIPHVRRKPRPDSLEILFNPPQGEIDQSSLEGLDAVVNLAGESIGSGRWTSDRKSRILKSRIDATSLISRTIASLISPPRVLVSASAVGFYGDCGSNELTEEGSPGEGFLADVCRKWEAACEPAGKAGIRVVNIRTGLVLTQKGGSLPRMTVPFRFGLGGRIGSGHQYMSWITLHDAVRAILFLVENPNIIGPVNLTSPNPITNADFAGALGRALHRPAVFPLPALVVRAIFGEMGRELLLFGQRVKPDKLIGNGFEWGYPDIDAALRKSLSEF